MAQYVVQITISGDVPEADFSTMFFSYLPDLEEIEEIIDDLEEIKGDYIAEYKKYSIGSGEIGTEEIFSEEELESFFEKDDEITPKVEEYGFECALFEQGLIE